MAKAAALKENVMNIISEEHEAITKFLLPEVIEFAKKHDDLVEPDIVTQRILLKFLGVGFSLGVAYNQTTTDKEWRERLSDAFKIVKKGSQ